MLRLPAQRLLGLELLAAHAQVLQEQLLLSRRLALDLFGLAVQVDEDVDLRLQDERLDGLEHIVHRSRRVAAEDVHVVLVVRREEQDRDARRARAAADERGHLVAIHARHLHVEQDHGEILPEGPAQGFLRGVCQDHVDCRISEDLRGGEQIALIVVDDQDFRSDCIRSSEPGELFGGGSGTSRTELQPVRHCVCRSRPCAPLTGAALSTTSPRLANCTRSTARSWSMSIGFET